MFGIQSFRSFGVPSKEDRFPLFVVMCIGSLMMSNRELETIKLTETIKLIEGQIAEERPFCFS